MHAARRDRDVRVVLIALFVVSGAVLITIINNLWDRTPAPATAP